MTDETAIWDAVLDMYDGFLAGDRAQVDRHLHEDVTIWDSEEADLAVGRRQLDEIRSRRPVGDSANSVHDLQAGAAVIDVWGDTALCRHLLVVHLADGRTQRVRNTGVWRRFEGSWQLVHNHEDVLSD